MSSPVEGINPDFLAQIKALMGQMAPSDQDKKTALSHGLLQAGFGILANAANNPWVAVGKGASTGLLGYNDELKQIQGQRNQNLQAASTVMPMLMADQYRRSQQRPQTTGQTVPPQTSDANVVTTPLSPDGQQGQPMPQGGPQAAPVTPQGGGTIYDAAARLGIPKELVDAAMASPNPQGAGAALLEKFAAPQSYRPGGYRVVNGQLQQLPALPPGTTLVDGKAVPVPGAQELAAQGKGLTAHAEEEAKAPYEMVKVPQSNNTEKLIPKSDYISSMVNGPNRTDIATSKRNLAGVDTSQLTPAEKAAAATPTTPVTSGVTMSPVAQAREMDRQKQMAEKRTGWESEASAATEASATVADMIHQLKSSNPSALAPARNHLANWVIAASNGALTADSPFVQAIASGNPGAAGALDKDTTILQTALTKTMGTRVAASEFMKLLSAIPNNAQNPDAIAKVLDSVQGINNWKIDRAKQAEEWANSPVNPDKGNIEKFENWYNANNPASKYIPHLQGNGSPADRAAQQRGYGVDIKNGEATQNKAKSVVRTGTLNGRKVVQYSDGSTAYAP